jgi:hypothetical protein
MRPTIAAPSAENLENTAFEDMMPANDPDQLRDIIDLGSVRRLPSTRSAELGWSVSSSTGSAIAGSFG